MHAASPRSGLLVAASQSGSGKTLVTLALLRWARRRGLDLSPAKAGPDYIDPAFHAAAAGRPSVNLDPFAMRPALVLNLAQTQGTPLVIEGMMGLFDGAADGTGSAADLAAMLGLPVLLVVDCAKQSHSVAALVRGFRDHRPGLRFCGLALNRVGSARHEALLRAALRPLDLPILAVLPRREALVLPERHLGLVQAGETAELDAFLDRAADWFGEGADVAALNALLAPASPDVFRPSPSPRLPPLGARIAVARDEAFAFAYPHLLDGWRAAGAHLSTFSPLADEAPDPSSDAVFLPGGYPELHAGSIAAAAKFRAGMTAARERGAVIYGECGGYMVLGDRLEAADGTSHPMLGLLPVATSFKARRLHLGYRRLRPRPGGPWSGPLVGHEFHYASIIAEGAGERLFDAADALGDDLGALGLRHGRVSGSFAHVIDLA